MSGEGAAPEDDEQAMRDAVAASVEAVFQVGSAKRKRAEESLEERERELSKRKGSKLEGSRFEIRRIPSIQ